MGEQVRMKGRRQEKRGIKTEEDGGKGELPGIWREGGAMRTLTAAGNPLKGLLGNGRKWTPKEEASWAQGQGGDRNSDRHRETGEGIIGQPNRTVAC